MGEAPGKVENKQGQPFIGPSGEILTAALEELELPSFCITNVVCCIPWYQDTPKSDKIRVPSDEEAEACSDHLIELFNLCNPKLLVLLGNEARDHFPLSPEKVPCPIAKLRHPSYIKRRGGIGSLEYKRFLEAFSKSLIEAKVRHKKPFTEHEVILKG